ncbi:hypothetical protein JVU11DRAFT_9518 [Chiua virens]|nr:hypothetical protein JVU11DRAFT_9518 [Chiua virens]
MYKPDKRLQSATQRFFVSSLSSPTTSSAQTASATTLGGHHGTCEELLTSVSLRNAHLYTSSGVYLCIRCSGIHRGMGTHISRVKSIDLDMWTPEQMESIQKWGNRRANLYWEAHLKAGHVPPDHKMESYIRSKYESHRILQTGTQSPKPNPLHTRHVRKSLRRSSRLTLSQFTHHIPPKHSPLWLPIPPTPFRRRRRARPGAHHTTAAAAAATSVPAQTPTSKRPCLRSTFTRPPSLRHKPPAKDVKQDILSLFSQAPSAAPAQTNAFGQFASAPAPAPTAWDVLGTSLSHAQGTPSQPQRISMMGTSGTGMWGVSSGWNSALPNTAPSTNIWDGANTTSASGGANVGNATFNTTDIWGGSATHSTSNGLLGAQSATVSKKDDVFGELWGDFK